MNDARFRFLADRHAPTRDVVAIDETNNVLTLRCGHTKKIASHFDCRHVEQTACFECGKEYVRNHPECDRR